MTNHSVVSFHANFGLIFKGPEDKATNSIESGCFLPSHC